MTAILSTQDLTMEFRGFRALDGVRPISSRAGGLRAPFKSRASSPAWQSWTTCGLRSKRAHLSATPFGSLTRHSHDSTEKRNPSSWPWSSPGWPTATRVSCRTGRNGPGD